MLNENATSTTTKQTGDENDINFWGPVQAYRRFKRDQEAVRRNPDRKGRMKGWRLAAAANFPKDLESATREALRGTGLFEVWQRLVEQDAWPEAPVRQRIIRLCATMYRKRGLQLQDYLKRRAPGVHSTARSGSSRRNGGCYKHRVLRKQTRAFCKDHGIQFVTDYFPNPDGSVLRLKCGCDRPESLKTEVPPSRRDVIDSVQACAAHQETNAAFLLEGVGTAA